jgi:hypothetical protein
MDDFCVGHMDDFVRAPRTLKTWVDHAIIRTPQQSSPETNSWLRNPDYDTLKLRLEIAHAAVEAAAVEARRRVRLNDGR